MIDNPSFGSRPEHRDRVPDPQDGSGQKAFGPGPDGTPPEISQVVQSTARAIVMREEPTTTIDSSRTDARVVFVADAVDAPEAAEVEEVPSSRVIADVLRTEGGGGAYVIGVEHLYPAGTTSMGSQISAYGKAIVNPLSDYEIYVFPSGSTEPVTSTRYAVADELTPPDMPQRERGNLIDKLISDTGEWRGESPAAYFTRQVELGRNLAAEVDGTDSEYGKNSITNHAHHVIIDAAQRVRAEHPELRGYFRAQVDETGRPTTLVVRPLIERNTAARLLDPSLPLVAELSDDEVHVDAGGLITPNALRLRACLPPEGWQLSDEARARFDEMPAGDKLRFIHERRDSLDIDTRDLYGPAIRDVLELEVDDPRRAGVMVASEAYGNVSFTASGRQDWYDIQVVFPDNDGVPVAIRGDLGEVADAYAATRPDDEPRDILHHIDKRIEDVGEKVPEPIFVKYNRHLDEVKLNDDGTRMLSAATRERLLSETVRRSADVVLTYPQFGRDLWSVKCDETGDPTSVTFRTVQEDPRTAAARLLGTGEQDGTALQVSLGPAYTTSLEGLSRVVRGHIRTNWEGLQRKFPTSELSPSPETEDVV